MKKLIFINGPNGIGKSTTCKRLHEELERSAWLESEWARRINPFGFSEEIEILTEKNMTFLLRSYLTCSEVDYVIFNWGFHGKRKKILERVLKNLSDIEFEYLPITFKCDLDENIKRMKNDNRSDGQIERNNEIRAIYDELDFLSIDITHQTTNEIVSILLKDFI